jgi:hypothetical protein
LKLKKQILKKQLFAFEGHFNGKIFCEYNMYLFIKYTPFGVALISVFLIIFHKDIKLFFSSHMLNIKKKLKINLIYL